MKSNELKKLIQSGDVGKVVLNRIREATGPLWEVWAYDCPDSDQTTVQGFGNRLIVERTRQPKTYTSLDRAWSALRELGYAGVIEIDSGPL